MPDPATLPPLADQGDGPTPAGADGVARGLLERQLGVLGRLAEVGLNIALAVERQVMAAEAGLAEAGSPGSPEKVQAVQGLALAYGRVSRAVRLTLALQSRLVKELQEIEAAARLRRTGEAANAGRARKARVERIVERMIRAEVDDAAEGDRLAEEAYERLEHDDIYGDLSSKPVSEIIALVCRDLGLAPDWGRLAQEAWAQEEIDGGAAGAPLRALRWLDPPQPQPPPAGPRARAPQAASP